MLMELTHLEEVAEQLQKHAASPQHLPPASEQVIMDIKGRDAAQWSLATPPSSPSLSLGSRKSSVCSISSLTSSSSGSCKSHPSPSAGHPSSAWHRSVSQQVSPAAKSSLALHLARAPPRRLPHRSRRGGEGRRASLLDVGWSFTYMHTHIRHAVTHCLGRVAPFLVAIQHTRQRPAAHPGPRAARWRRGDEATA